MRNISHATQQQTSREFYNQVLKNKSKNLNSSKKEINFLENGLDKLLQQSYKVLAPIFNDGQNNTNFEKEASFNNIDQDFDQQIQDISPEWLKKLTLLLIKVYHFIFPKKIKLFIQKKLKRKLYQLISSKSNSATKTITNFFAFKPPT